MASKESVEKPKKPRKKWTRRDGRKNKVPQLAEKQVKQSHFIAVEHYLRGASKKDALLAAGYSQSFAEKQAFTVFDRPDVLKMIEERRYRVRTRSHMMIDRIQEELARIAFFNVGELISITDDGELVFDFTDATLDEFAAIGEVSVEVYTEGQGKDAEEVKRVKVKPLDKKAALDSLARIYGMFQDNLSISPGEGGSVEERLAKGRARIAKKDESTVVEGEVVSTSVNTAGAVSRDTKKEEA